jgi:hypothetical protein
LLLLLLLLPWLIGEQVSSIDIARVVCDHLLAPTLDHLYDNVKTIELEGPKKYSPVEQGTYNSNINIIDRSIEPFIDIDASSSFIHSFIHSSHI